MIGWKKLNQMKRYETLKKRAKVANDNKNPHVRIGIQELNSIIAEVDSAIAELEHNNAMLTHDLEHLLHQESDTQKVVNLVAPPFK